MVNVDFLKTRVETLAVKSQNGYASSSAFNSDLSGAITTLFKFYYRHYEETQELVDALMDMVIEVPLTLTNGTSPLPSDYHHRLEITYNKVTNQDCGDQPLVSPQPVDYVLQNELAYVLSSPIRKPSISKNIIRHTFKNNLLYVYPKEVTIVNFKYLKKPAAAFWGSTLVSTPTGDFEQYDPNTSIQCDFAETETENLTSLLLFYLGIELRETPLIQFAKEKMATP